jgi:hypothetical protein
MKTESYTAYWERRKTEAEKLIQIADLNLTRIALQDHLQLFQLPQAEVYEIRPLKEVVEELAHWKT